MFNMLPFNTQEFNGTGAITKIVALAAAVTVDVNVDPAAFDHIRGLASSTTVDISASPAPALDTLVILGANAAVDVTQQTAMYRRRNLGADVGLTTVGLIGSGIVWNLEADVLVEVDGVLLPFDFLAEANVSTDVTAEASLTKIRMLGGETSVDVSMAPTGPGIVGQRRMFADVGVELLTIASPDVEVGGILYVQFGTDGQVTVDAEATIDPTKFLYVDSLVETSAFASAIKVRDFYGNRSVDVDATAELFSYTDAFETDAIVDIQPAVYMVRVATLAADVAVEVNHEPVRLRNEALLAAKVDVEVSGAATVRRFANMLVASTVDIIGEGDIKLAVKFYAAAEVAVDVSATADMVPFTLFFLEANATVDVDVEAALFRQTFFDADVLVEVDANGSLRINAIAFEPDYRTILVEPEDDKIAVEPESFIIVVSDDGGTVETKQKQPLEVLPYDIDFAPWFAGIDGTGTITDDIDSANCVVVAASSGPTSALNVDEVTIINSDPDDPMSDAWRVKVWLSGGTNGVTYKLTVTITTTAGRVKEVDFRMKIKEL